MGEPTGTGGEVFSNVEVREITDAEINNLGYIYQGLDFGFAADPAAFVRLAYDRKSDTIFFWELWEVNKELLEEHTGYQNRPLFQATCKAGGVPPHGDYGAE